MQVSCPALHSRSLPFIPFLFFTFWNKWRKRILISLYPSTCVTAILADRNFVKFCFKSDQKIPKFYWTCFFITMFNTSVIFFRMLCQISPFHKLSSGYCGLLFFHLSLVLPSDLLCSTLIIALCIYALHLIFHKPFPFSCPAFHNKILSLEQPISKVLLRNFR